MEQGQELYNPELKLKYLKYRYETQNASAALVYLTQRTLAAVAPKEFELNKDVCTMTPEELSSAVKPFYSTKKSTNRGRLSHIRKYCEWCIKNGVPGATNVTSQIRVGALDRFKEGHLPSPLALKKYLDAAIPLSDKPAISEVRPRVAYWLAFSGVSLGLASSLKTSDVNLENLMILDRFPIYPEALGDFRLCMQSWFWYERSDVSPQRQRIDNDLFLRGFRGGINVGQICGDARKDFINKAVEDGKVPYPIRYSALMTDGFYYRIYQEEISSGELTDRQVKEQAFKAVSNRIIATKGRVNPELEEKSSSYKYAQDNIRAEYPVWKDAFGL